MRSKRAPLTEESAKNIQCMLDRLPHDIRITGIEVRMIDGVHHLVVNFEL